MLQVLVEAESLVPVDLGTNLEALLAEADYVFTSAVYPQVSRLCLLLFGLPRTDQRALLSPPFIPSPRVSSASEHAIGEEWLLLEYNA